MIRQRLTVLAASCLALAASAPVLAGLWEDLYRGLGIAATPTGTRDGQRFGRLAVVPNRLGKGWDIEFDRSFGADGRGRPEVYDLGAAELELSGAVQSTLGFTRRLFMIGNADTNINNLNYTLRFKSGAQDATLTGLMNGQGSLEVNQFGFYDFSLNVANTNGALTLDGVVVNDSEATNFDIGPINVKGNLFFDGAVALLSSLGVDTSGLASNFGKSPIDQIAAAIQEQLRAIETRVAGVSVTSPAASAVADTQSAIVASVLGAPGQAGSPAAFESARIPTGNGQTARPTAGVVPEPGTVGLVLLGTAMLVWRRRHAG